MLYIAGDAGQSALDSEAKEGGTGGIERKSTRAWAMEIGHDPEKIFNKVRWCMAIFEVHRIGPCYKRIIFL